MKNLHIIYALALSATFAGYAVAVFAQTSGGGTAGGGMSGGSGTMTGTPSGGTVSGTGTTTGTGSMNATPGMHTSGTPGSTNGTASMRTGPTASTTTGVANTTGIDGSAGLRSMSGTSGMASNWNSDNTYWQNQFSSRPYYNGTSNYQTYQPAYQFGFNTYTQFGGRPFQDLNQQQLRGQWERTRGTSSLNWDQAQPAIRDEYNRVYNSNHNTNTSPATAAPAR